MLSLISHGIKYEEVNYADTVYSLSIAYSSDHHSTRKKLNLLEETRETEVEAV